MGPTWGPTKLAAPILLPDLRMPILFLLHFDHSPDFILSMAQTSARTLRKAMKDCFTASASLEWSLQRAWLWSDSRVRHHSHLVCRQWGGRQMQFTCFPMLGPQYLNRQIYSFRKFTRDHNLWRLHISNLGHKMRWKSLFLLVYETRGGKKKKI